MHYMVNIGHPAHVHFFRNFLQIMRSRGHTFLVTARQKEATLHLMRAYGIPYHELGRHERSAAAKAVGMLRTDAALLKLARKSRPDGVIGVSNMYGAQVARVLSRPSFVFTDTEQAWLENSLAFPFATHILVPSAYRGEFGRRAAKVVRYDGFKELAYLHPDYFRPDTAVVRELGLAPGERFAVVRFVSWGAAHDAGHRGLTAEQRNQLVLGLASKVKVFVSSEAPLPESLARFALPLAPEKVHHVLAQASLYVGEGATMACEAAVLGTPTVYVNPISAGTLEEFENRYGLIVGYREGSKVLDKSLELLADKGSAEDWKRRRTRLLGEKIDVTKFMVDFVESHTIAA